MIDLQPDHARDDQHQAQDTGDGGGLAEPDHPDPRRADRSDADPDHVSGADGDRAQRYLPRLLTEPAFRARVTRTTTDPVLRGFWEGYESLSEAGRAQVIGPLLNKLRAFLLRPWVRAAIAAGPSTVEFGDVLDGGGICLARLPKGSIGEETSRLVGSLLVARTWQAATARARQPAAARADASLVLDEAQKFLNLSTPVEDMRRRRSIHHLGH